MKNLILLLSVLSGTFSFSAQATVVAEDTAEHTITFNFGRPTADTYLCEIYLYGSEYSSLDTLTFSNGDSINGDRDSGNNYRQFFTPDSAPTSSTLHLGSANYGTSVQFRFCHDLQIPSGSPVGQIDTFYKIQTPSSWSYFSNAQVMGQIYAACNDYGLWSGTGPFSLASNTATDFTLLGSVPFPAEEPFSVVPTQCKTVFAIEERASGPRPANESAGNITVGVKDQINFN